MTPEGSQMGEPYATGFPDLDEEIFKLRAELAQVKKELEALDKALRESTNSEADAIARAESAEAALANADAAARERVAKFLEQCAGEDGLTWVAPGVQRIRANELE